MNTNEYTKLDQLDRQHWFHTGKRATVKHWINRNVALKPDDLLIDAGCGTGTFLTEMSSSCGVIPGHRGAWPTADGQALLHFFGLFSHF